MTDIIQGDAVSTLAGFDAESIDLTVFSPPYDAIRTYNDSPEFDLAQIGAELYRVTVDGGVCAMIISDGTKNFAKSLTTFRTAVQWVDSLGWKLFECCIYHRDGRPGKWWNRRFRVDHEYILIFFKGTRPRVFHKEHLRVPAKTAGKTWKGTLRLSSGLLVPHQQRVSAAMKCRGTVWKYATSNSERNRTKLQHPATMPDKLAADLIQTFTDEGDTVLDPMCGSGTTLVKAAQLNRKFIGIDICQEYVSLSQQRLAAEVSAA